MSQESCTNQVDQVAYINKRRGAAEVVGGLGRLSLGLGLHSAASGVAEGECNEPRVVVLSESIRVRWPVCHC